MKKLALGLGLLALLMSCGGGANTTSGEANVPKVPLTVMLDWVPNTNHIGLYVAQSLGYFAEAGLDVSILQPPEDGGLDFLLTGQSDVMIGWESTLFFGRDRGLPLVAVAAILQENDSVLVALPSSGITRPRDLVGKRYLSYGSANDIETVRSIMEIDGVLNPEVTMAASGSMANMDALLQGQGDYLWVFRGWDLLATQLRGIELNEILVRDYDDALNFYTPMYITTDDRMAQKSGDLSKLMQAIARGYEFASANPQAASDIMLSAVPGLDRALIEASTRHLASLYLDESGDFGVMRYEVFDRYRQWASAHGLLPADGANVRTAEIYTNRLLEK
jgi:ABC-type nitrate/sulfonate/bicarbonate transport system substrate-binding protein